MKMRGDCGMVERHKRRFSLLSLPLREVDGIDRRRLFERSELRSRGEGRGGMALKIFSKAESFRNLPGVIWIVF